MLARDGILQSLHDWRHTGVRRKHVDGRIEMFRHGTQIVDYVKCDRCGWVGFRRPGSQVIYTWRQ